MYVGVCSTAYSIYSFPITFSLLLVTLFPNNIDPKVSSINSNIEIKNSGDPMSNILSPTFKNITVPGKIPIIVAIVYLLKGILVTIYIF